MGSLEINDIDVDISSGIRAQQLEREWGAHSFASNTLEVHCRSIQLVLAFGLKLCFLNFDSLTFSCAERK